MKRKIELLAPGGDIDSIKAAITAGADAVYCGLDRFNARNRAANITFAELNGILRLAHRNDCEVFLTLNIIIVESEIPALLTLLNKLVNTTIDGVIVQDLGMFYLLATYFPTLHIHASTQLTTHNEGQVQFLRKLAAVRVNLSRELSLSEIKELTVAAHENNLLTEVFVHGSYCLSFSGICYMSSVHGGNSGNRGRCSQPCRNQYATSVAGKNFPLNLKDNSAYSDIRALADAGVDSMKIEGRIKKFHYVHTVVSAFHKQLRRLYDQESMERDNGDLHRVFNRDFSNGFLRGDINRDMFIDNPRDNSAIHRSQVHGDCTEETLEQAKRELYDEKTEIITNITRKIETLHSEQAPLQISVSGKAGTPLAVSVKTPEIAFVVLSDTHLTAVKNKKNSAQCLTQEMLSKRLKAVNATEYFIANLDLEELRGDLFLPFQALTAVKKKILFILNGSQKFVDSIDVPFLQKQDSPAGTPSLSLLIASQEDVYLCDETSADIYFQLPAGFAGACSECVDLFRNNKQLLPWFPSVLIGGDYRAAVDFLQQVQPERIVTDNSGIAYAASEAGIAWIAGPHLNSVNSFSLLCLKEKCNCSGAFISNELKKNQIKQIKKPTDFKLYYSIYHPITLMTSRQCLLYQVTGCEKNRIDHTCMQQCEQSSSITNLQNVSFFIEKSKGNYHSLYNETHFLNTDIVTDIPGVFSSFFIDLREIKNNTRVGVDTLRIIRLFEGLLTGNSYAIEEIQRSIHPTTNSQYQNGI